MPCSVLIADSDATVRAALRLLLAQQPQFRVVGESHNLDELLRHVATSKPDLILLDWDLRGLGVESRQTLLPGLFATTATVVLSTRDEQRSQALSAGARAFVSKGDPPSQLLETLRWVAGLVSDAI